VCLDGRCARRLCARGDWRWLTAGGYGCIAGDWHTTASNHAASKNCASTNDTSTNDTSTNDTSTNDTSTIAGDTATNDTTTNDASTNYTASNHTSTIGGSADNWLATADHGADSNNSTYL